jgi:hypothetical protein
MAGDNVLSYITIHQNHQRYPHLSGWRLLVPSGRPTTHPLTTGDLHMSERGGVDYFPLILADRFWNLDLIDETV